jgi:hypothetical protein
MDEVCVCEVCRMRARKPMLTCRILRGISCLWIYGGDY